MLSKDQKIAFAAFLQSERDRHMEDIEMIDEKLKLLAAAGIFPDRTAPWITLDDLTEGEH